MDNSIIAHLDPKSPISEAYRVLRTNIQYSSVDKPLKSLVVTSAGPGEGKSTTIINLAVTFAQSGSRVLIIDADMRKPRVHKIFETTNKEGLVNVLAQIKKLEDVIYTSPIENLDVLTSGPVPPNPSELLASNSMKIFIKEASSKYDVVLIDAPPIGAVTDAAILSTVVDGTIIVAAAGQVETEALKRAKELLEKVNANIIGVVMNKMDKKSSGSSYYYYYSYYGENTEPKPKKKLFGIFG